MKWFRDNFAEAEYEKAVAEGKNIYAYKIVVENKSTAAVKVNIDSSTESNAQVDVYAGEEFATATKLANEAGVDFDKTDIAANTGTCTYYIVVTANTDLGNMTAAEATDFDITIVVTAQ